MTNRENVATVGVSFLDTANISRVQMTSFNAPLVPPHSLAGDTREGHLSEIVKTPTELLAELLSLGGAIVTSGVCSEMEIADAQATGRFAVDSDGIGFVRRYKEWLEIARRLSDNVTRAESRIAELEAQLDLNRDEFLRIKNLVQQQIGLREGASAPRFGPEIVGLCERSQQVIRQRVPLIQQLDNATKEAAAAVARMHDAESEICMMQSQMETMCAESDRPKIDAGRLIQSLPPDVNKKVSLHDLKRICDNYNGQKVINLSGGATATVSHDCPPEAVAGLDEMARHAAKAVREGALVGDSSPSLPSAGARFLAFAGEIQRIANGKNTTLGDMRDALNYALENAELL